MRPFTVPKWVRSVSAWTALLTFIPMWLFEEQMIQPFVVLFSLAFCVTYFVVLVGETPDEAARRVEREDGEARARTRKAGQLIVPAWVAEVYLDGVLVQPLGDARDFEAARTALREEHDRVRKLHPDTQDRSATG